MSGHHDLSPNRQHAGLVCLLLDEDGGLKWSNAEAAWLGSFSREAPKNLLDLVHPEDRGDVAELLREARENGHAVGTIRIQDALTGAVRYLQLVLGAANESPVPHTRWANLAGLQTFAQLPAMRAGRQEFLAQAWDVTTLVQRQQDLETHAFKDALTGVANLRTFMTQLNQELEVARRLGPSIAVLFIDIDDLKDVNSAHGQPTGDLALIALASRLSSSLRPQDTLARIGGDEFAVICTNLSGWPTALTIVDRLRTAATQPISTPTGPVGVTISIGVAFAEETPSRPDAAAQLVALADQRMFRDKSADRGAGG